MIMLTIDQGTIDEHNTAELRHMKRLRARTSGDLSLSVESAGHHAQKSGKTAFVYLGNSYGHAVWRVSFKRGDYLNSINNTGNTVYSVDSDLTLRRHNVIR
jgi:hypothetical protein